MPVIQAICTSERRGTPKTPLSSARLLTDFGIEGDAHAGHWHRQVSLLSQEKIDAFRARGAQVMPGAFGENLVVSGIDFRRLPVGTRLRSGDVLMEITQIGKECHSHCAIYRATGDCIMPREGVFARVLTGGTLRVGDEMTVEPYPGVRPWQAAVITLSDKGARGERVDESGPAIVRRLTDLGYEVIEQLLLSDDEDALQAQLIRLCDQRQPDLILTTGGTGFSPRDVTPEATLAVATRNAPGIAEALRWYSLQITPRAMLSRGASVIRKRTLIVNLPGNVKAVNECIDFLQDALPHALALLRGDAGDCART